MGQAWQAPDTSKDTNIYFWVSHKTDVFAHYLTELPLNLCWQFNVSKQGQKEKRWQDLSVSSSIPAPQKT